MPLVPAFIINACRDLSWVAPDAARLVARGVHAAFEALSFIDDEAHAVAGDVCNKLLWVEDALLLHDPERLESLRRAREQIAAWNAAHQTSSPTSTPPLVGDPAPPQEPEEGGTSLEPARGIDLAGISSSSATISAPPLAPSSCGERVGTGDIRLLVDAHDDSRAAEGSESRAPYFVDASLLGRA